MLFIFAGSSCTFGAEAELAGAARASLLVRHVLAEPCVWDLGAMSVDIKPLQRVGQQRRQKIPTVTPIGQVKSMSYNYCETQIPGVPYAWLLPDATHTNYERYRTVSNESLSSNVTISMCNRWPVAEVRPRARVLPLAGRRP